MSQVPEVLETLGAGDPGAGLASVPVPTVCQSLTHRVFLSTYCVVQSHRRALSRGPGGFAILRSRATGGVCWGLRPWRRGDGSTSSTLVHCSHGSWAPALQSSRPRTGVLAHSRGWGGLSGPSEPAPQDRQCLSRGCPSPCPAPPSSSQDHCFQGSSGDFSPRTEILPLLVSRGPPHPRGCPHCPGSTLLCPSCVAGCPWGPAGIPGFACP